MESIQVSRRTQTKAALNFTLSVSQTIKIKIMSFLSNFLLCLFYEYQKAFHKVVLFCKNNDLAIERVRIIKKQSNK